MVELKTKPTGQSVEDFLNSIPDEKKRKDAYTILDLMRQATGSDPKMWDSSIIGFGSHRYKYASGREGDWFQVGFSPRKQNLTLYIMYGYEQSGDLMQRLGKYKTGKACLYINKIEDVDLAALKELIDRSVEFANKNSA